MDIRFSSSDNGKTYAAAIIMVIFIPALFLTEAFAANTAVPEFQICQLTAAGSDSSIQAQCTEIMVPENPEDPEGKQIPLKIVIIPAKHRNKAADPVFLLAGGPGQSISEAFPALSKAFGRIQEERDLVLLDQRGTGGSNPLKCSESDELPLTDLESINFLRNCLGNFNVDLSYYATKYYIEDLEYVRDLLGYEKINLYGASYGTRVAQEYLWTYPERVRTIILDSVTYSGYLLFYDFLETIPRALEKMLTRCEADQNCHTAFPNIREELLTVIERLQNKPVSVQVRHPLTGKPVEFKLTKKLFLRCLLPHLYAPETVALLPLTIHAAYEYEDYLPLIGQSASFDMGIHIGLMAAVACAEDIPFIPPEDDWPPAGPFDYHSSIYMWQEICQDLKLKETIAPTGPKPSDVPVLFLSGDADPVTPPEIAEKARKYFPNSVHIIAPNFCHGLMTQGCMNDIAAAFITTGTVKDLDLNCMNELQPAPFFINPNGPTP